MPVFRRFGRPGLLGGVARTAVVAGTPTMTARAIHHGARAYESGQTVPATTPAAESITSQLATLSELKTSGAINDAEFAKAKQQVLGAYTPTG